MANEEVAEIRGKLDQYQALVTQQQQQILKLMSACAVVASVYEDLLEGKALDREGESPVRNEDIYACYLVVQDIDREDSELFIAIGGNNVSTKEQMSSDSIANKVFRG